MNLIDENFEVQKKDNSKTISKIILIMIILLIIAIIGIFATIVYIQSSTLNLYINGVGNLDVREMMIEEDDGTIYFPIKEIASYLGYESFNGEYTDKSEEANKCYIKNENEIANFELNSNKIYKLIISNNSSNYTCFYANKPVKAINGKLYAPIDAIKDAFNISFTYDTENKKIYIYTIPYLAEAYTTMTLDLGYESISKDFINQKAILNNLLIVTKNNNTYAVIDTKGNTIIEPKYDYIEYLPNSGDFLVRSNNKVGIISSKRETKVQILYDSLELIDNDSGLYVAKKDNKYGVIDSNGKIKIYIEYDQIGIDISKFEKNNIKNKYLLENGMIPVKKDKLWGAFDKNGNQILDFKYDSFGYIATTNKDAINLLIIPDYNVMVVCKDQKYTLVNSEGKELFLFILDDIYMRISGGEKYYYMNYYDNIGVNVEDVLEQIKETSKNNKTDTKENVIENRTDEFVEINEEE